MRGGEDVRVARGITNLEFFMEEIKNAFKAPFSDAAAAATTPAKTAIAYGLAGWLLAVLTRKA